MSANPNDFLALIPDPTSSKCSAFSRVLLQLPSLLYRWMVSNFDANGKPKGALKPGDYIWSATASAEDASRLLCNGQEVSKTTYALLFAAIGTTYGAASSPATNFKLPDHRARFPIMVGSTAKPVVITLGSIGGEDEHILTTDELPAHAHAIATTSIGKAGDTFPNPANPNVTGNPTTTSQSTEEAGGDDPHNNLPPYFGSYLYLYTGLGV